MVHGLSQCRLSQAERYAGGLVRETGPNLATCMLPVAESGLELWDEPRWVIEEIARGDISQLKTGNLQVQQVIGIANRFPREYIYEMGSYRSERVVGNRLNDLCQCIAQSGSGGDTSRDKGLLSVLDK